MGWGFFLVGWVFLHAHARQHICLVTINLYMAAMEMHFDSISLLMRVVFSLKGIRGVFLALTLANILNLSQVEGK